MVDVSGVDQQLSFGSPRSIRPESALETPRNGPAEQDDRSTSGTAKQSQTGVPETVTPAPPPTPTPAGASEADAATTIDDKKTDDRIEISPEATALAAAGPEIVATEIAPEAAAPTSEDRSFFESDLDTDLLSSERQPPAAPRTGSSTAAETETGPPALPTIDQSSLGSETATPASAANTLKTGIEPSDPGAALQAGVTEEGSPVTNQETSSELERTGNDNQSRTEANRTLGQVVDVFA